MLSVTDSNYRQSVTSNVSNVTQNACVNSSFRQVRWRSFYACVKLRYVRFANVVNHAENVGFLAENIVFCKNVGGVTRGIVKILFVTVCIFRALLKCKKYAHQNLLKLQYVENTVLLSLRTALKIRVSVVRFRPRPPNSNEEIRVVPRSW